MPERRYDIDWLRVIAMLAVFLFHCSGFFTPLDWHLKNDERSQILLKNGAIGLTLVIITLGVFLNGRLAFWVAVLRETFEEAGVLIARHPASGEIVDFPGEPARGWWTRPRVRLAVVTTDLPLLADPPGDDASVIDACTACPRIPAPASTCSAWSSAISGTIARRVSLSRGTPRRARTFCTASISSTRRVRTSSPASA